MSAATDEQRRLEVLARYEILATPPDETFDRITRLAARLFNVPIVLVSLVAHEYLWFKSCHGLDIPQTDRSVSFCSHAILGAGVMVVPDATQDARFVDNPLVTHTPHIRFYAGAPLEVEPGLRLGTLCLIDTVPHASFSVHEQEVLRDLAAMVMSALELHRTSLMAQRESTQRVRAEATLREANALLARQGRRFRAALGSAHVVVWEVDLTTGAVYHEVDYAAMGVPEQLFPKTVPAWLGCIHPDDRKEARTLFVRAVRSSQPFDAEYRLCLPDRTLWVAVQGQRREVAEGPRLVGVIADITPRKQTEAALRESEARFRQLAETINDAFWLSDARSYQVLYVSPAFETLWELPRARLYNDPWAFLAPVHPDDRARVERVSSSIERGGYDETYRLVRPDGSVRWVRECAFPIRDAHGEIYRLAGVAKDVTEQHLAQLALMHAKDEAERANAAKSEFLSRMSHELRTPLNAILGFAQLLELEDLGDDEQHSVNHIVKAGRHLLSLINEVLDIARIESGKLSLSLEPVALAEVVHDATTLVGPLAVAQGVGLHASANLVGVYVLADRQRLGQVLLNLLANAVKYNHLGGWVVVDCEESGGYVRLGVQDGGRGIAQEHLERVFEPFDRLGAEALSVEGTGIGLTLSKRLTEAMGGSIGVESRLGEGSTFWLTLTAAEVHPLDPVDDPALLRPVVGASAHKVYRVLYIEDNPANLELIRRFMRYRPEVDLLTATHAALGLELAASHHPDAILLDLHLPDAKGESVLAQLKAGPLHATPVLIITADALLDRAALSAAGAHTLLTKPLTLSTFLAAFDAALGVTTKVTT